MSVINCHIPIKITITGRPTDAQLEELCDRLSSTLNARLEIAERTIAQALESSSRPGDVDVVRAPYEESRDLRDQQLYALPSYDNRGEPHGVSFEITDPLEIMAGVTPASIQEIVLDTASHRVRFLTVGGKAHNGTITGVATRFGGEGKYELRRPKSKPGHAADPNRTWDIFYPDGRPFRGGMEFSVALDMSDVAFQNLNYKEPVRLSVVNGVLPKLVNLEATIKLISELAGSVLLSNVQQQEIIRLLSEVPVEQAPEIVKRLRETLVNGQPLIDRLDDAIDSDANIELHEVLSRLKVQSGGDAAAAKIANAIVLAWHDVMGFFEQTSVFAIEKTSKGKIRIRYLGGIAGGLYSNPEYDEIKDLDGETRLNLMTADGLEFDPEQPVIVHDYDSGRQILMTAEDLIAFQHLGIRKFLSDVGTLASVATPIGAETALARVASYAIQITRVAVLIAEENKLNLRKWFPNWGPKILAATEKIKIALAVVDMAQLLRGGWGLFRNLRRLRNARKAMDAAPIVSSVEEAARADQQALTLESQADKILDDAQKARRELGLPDDLSQSIEQFADETAQAEGQVAQAIDSSPEQAAVVGNIVSRTPAQRAREYIARWQGRILDPDNALEETFRRAADPSLRVQGRAAAAELRTIEGILNEGLGGRSVASVEVIPSSSAGRTPDLVVHFGDGTVTRVEIRTVSSAPRGRVVPKSTGSRGAAARQLLEDTEVRLPTQTDVENAVLEKAKDTTRRPSQLTAPLTGVPSGGTIFVQLPYSDMDPAMVTAAIVKISPSLGAHVEQIVVVVQLPRPSPTEPLRFGALTYVRQGNIFSLIP
ncbi:hypothetical protein [Schlesneria sp. T3-172]|uniref:hypothetical protein n=1 Tax=Schlesneria sphaerica TaxID=3373610 RepID=UPI0037C6A51F